MDKIRSLSVSESPKETCSTKSREPPFFPFLCSIHLSLHLFPQFNLYNPSSIHLFLGPPGQRKKENSTSLRLRMFPEICVFELCSPKLKKLAKFCFEWVPVLLHPILYRVVKQTCPIDIGGIVQDGCFTSELGTGNLEQFIWFLTPTDFCQVCE